MPVKISSLPTQTVLKDADVLAVVDDPAGIDTTKKITALNAKKYFTHVIYADDYGAKGDNSTNDRTAMQAALDAAYLIQPAEIQLRPGGVYLISSWSGANSNTPAHYALRVKSGVTFNGNGATIKLGAGAGPGIGGQGVIIGNDQTDGLSDITVENMKIDLTNGVTGSNLAGVVYGNLVSGGTPVARGKVRNVEVANSPYLGIQLRDGPTDFEISGCYVHDTGYIAIQASAGQRGLIAGNRVHTAGDNAIDIYGGGGTGGATTMSGINITGNVLTACRAGVFLETVSYCSAVGNTIDATQEGIVVNRVDSGDPSGNVITGNSIKAGMKGIWLSNVIYDATVSGNNIKLTANSAVGILVYFSFHNNITGNVICGNGAADSGIGVRVYSASTNNLVACNQFTSIAQAITVEDTSSAIERFGNSYYNVGAFGTSDVLTMHSPDGSSYALAVINGGVLTVGGAPSSGVSPTNAQTASYTLALTDIGKTVTMTVASANNLTVPPNSSVAFPVGTVIGVEQLGTGQTTIVAGSGVTVNSRGGLLAVAGQYGAVSLRKTATDTWLLVGDLA